MKITKRQLRQIIREAMDYDPLGDEGVPHVGVSPEYALAFIDVSYGDRRMEFVVNKRDAELARVVMKKLRKQGQTSGVQPTRQRFHPSEVTSREELLRLVGEPISESIDYSYQNWWEYGLNDGRAGDPPAPPDHPLEARDSYEDGYQEGLTLRRIAGLDAPLTESAGYKAWVEERGHITPAASSVIASYLTEFGLEPDGEEARRLAQEYGVDLRNISMAVRRERVERALMGEGADYDPMGDEGVPHVGVGPKYALAFIDASYGDRRMELVVDERDAELARVVMKKLRKQGQVSGVQPTRQRFHPSEVTSREELLRLVSEPMSESIDYSFQNWWEYGFTDARNGDPPNPPDRPLEARDAYEDGYQEGLDLHVLMGRSAPMTESMNSHLFREEWQTGFVAGRKGEVQDPPAQPQGAREAYIDGYHEGKILRLMADPLEPISETDSDRSVQEGWYELYVNSRGEMLYSSGPYSRMGEAQSAIRGKRDYVVGFVTQDVAEIYDGFTNQLIQSLPTSELYDMPTAQVVESRSSWSSPINLPSIDSLEAAGREGMASYSDIEAAREILPELEEYMEYNYRATLEDAADAWLEAHGYDDPGSPLASIRDEQREFVIRVGKQRGLDKI